MAAARGSSSAGEAPAWAVHGEDPQEEDPSTTLRGAWEWTADGFGRFKPPKREKTKRSLITSSPLVAPSERTNRTGTMDAPVSTQRGANPGTRDILATPPKSSALAPCSLLATSHVLLCALCSDESDGRAPFVWEGPPAHPPVQLGPQGWATIRGGGEGARASQGTRARQRTHRVRVLGIPIRRSRRRASTRAHRAPASHEGLQRIARSNLVLTGSCPLAVRPLYWRGEAWRACAERWSRRVPPLRWGGSPATGEKLPWPSTAFHCLPPPSTSLPPPSTTLAFHRLPPPSIAYH